MANYQTIMKLRPEVRDFVRNRRWVHQGDVLTYGPNVECDSFSIDGAGFRHSVFNGERFSVHQCVARERYGVVLGPSSVYGFGVAGNEHTMPSLLAERFGFPFANIGLPEGNSRNLHSILYAMAVRAAHRPTVVLHISGGDFTNFCYTQIADPIFGSPNLKQMKMAVEERGGRPKPDRQIRSLLQFTSLWISAIAELCRSRRIPLVLADDTTFFEKRVASELEQQCELGQPFNLAQQVQFDTHKQFVGDYHTCRHKLAERLGVPLAGPGRVNDIGFVDEFHYDRPGTRALCDHFAAAIDSTI